MTPNRLINALHRRLRRCVGLLLPETIDTIKGSLDDLRIRQGVDKGTQILLSIKYRELATSNVVLPFDEVEFRNHSQNGEDGILLYIFSLIGTTNKRCIEVCAGDGIQCNTANLIINHSWHGLLFDGNGRNVEQGLTYYRSHPDTLLCPPIMRHEWITAENISALIVSNGFEGQVDLLSIDMDGMDYWIWNAIDMISPRVVVIEVNLSWAADRSVTAPYNPNFMMQFFDGQPQPNAGASLPALIKLGQAKGYRFVGCQRMGFNAFFVRNDVGIDVLKEQRAEGCFGHPHAVWAKKHYRSAAETFEWIEV